MLNMPTVCPIPNTLLIVLCVSVIFGVWVGHAFSDSNKKNMKLALIQEATDASQ